MKKHRKRKLQLSDEIKKILSKIILKKIRDPKLELTTVTEVRLSDDLKYAKVYISIMGDEKDREKGLKILNNALKFIRKELASEINMRFVPEISFVLDESLERAFRINKILNDLKKDK